MSRIPKYTRGKAKEWYATMIKLDLMFHPDDSPEDIVSSKPGSFRNIDDYDPLFTAEECKELRVIHELIWADTDGDPCGAAYEAGVDAGLFPEH
jgi:hypothetical protein